MCEKRFGAPGISTQAEPSSSKHKRKRHPGDGEVHVWQGKMSPSYFVEGSLYACLSPAMGQAYVK